MGRVTSDVARGISVTQFIGVGHIATLAIEVEHSTSWLESLFANERCINRKGAYFPPFTNVAMCQISRSGCIRNNSLAFFFLKRFFSSATP